MRILSASLRNFKCHADAYFTFEMGTNAICGQNGAGKTSILEGIAWVLFDHTPYTQEDMIRAGANSAEVAVQFVSHLDDRTYEVRRSTTHGYQLYDPQLNHRLEHERKVDVLSWLRQHLGVPIGTDLARLFTTTIGVPQGTFTADFLKPASERKHVFNSILKVGEYLEVSKQLLGLEKHSNECVNQIKHEIELLQVQLQEWDPLHEEQRQLQLEQAEIVTTLQKLQTDLAHYQTTLAKLDQLAQTLAQFDHQIQATQHQQSLAIWQRDQADQALKQAQSAQQHVQTNQAGYQAFQAAEAKLRDLEHALQIRRKLLEEREALINHDREQHDQITRLQERLAILDQAAHQLKQLQTKIQTQETLETRIQEIETATKQLQDQHQELKLSQTRQATQDHYCQRLSQEVHAAWEAQQQCEQDQSGYHAFLQAEQRLVDLEKASAQRQELLQKRDQWIQEFHQIQLQQAGVQKEWDRLMRIQQDLSQLQPKIDHQVALESRLTDLQTKLQQFQSLRFQLDQKQKERDQIQNRFTQVNERIQHRVDLQSKVEQISDLEQQLERLGSQLSRVAAARQFQEEIQTTVALGQDQLSNHTQQVQQILRSLDRLQKDFPTIKTQLDPIPPILTQGTALTHQILQQLDQILVDISDQVSPAQLQAQQREIRQQLQDLYPAKVKVDQLPELQIERQDLETKRHDLEGEIEDLEWNLEAEGTFTRQQADLQDQLAQLGDPRAQAKIWEQELSQKPQLEANWQHLQDQLSHQHQQLQALDQDLHQLAYVDTEIPAMQQQRQQYRSAHQRYLQAEPLAQTLQQRQTDLAQAQHHLQTEIQQGSQLQAQIQAMQSRFGTLTELAQAHAQLSQDLQDLQDPRGQAQRLQEDLKQRPQLLQDLQDLHTQLQGSQQRIQDLDQELAKTTGLEGALSAEQAIREQHRSAYESYLNSLPIAQTLPECETTLQKAQQEVDQVLNHLTQLQDQHKQLGETYDPQQHEQLKITQRQTELEQARLQTRIQAIQPQLERIQTRIDHLKDLQEQQKQQGISLKERERLHRFIKFSREVLKRAGPRITELYLQNVNVVADRLFREILNRPNVSLNWEPDYDITIQESGCPKRRFISLSGGEQMSAALAVRLALLKVLGELDIAFFDEPTTNMDHQRRQRLAEAITNIRSFKQLFVISHDDTFEQVTENIIRVERSDLTPIREADNGA